MMGAIQGILAGVAVQAKEKRPYKKPVLNEFVPVESQVKTRLQLYTSAWKSADAAFREFARRLTVA